nr:hypothetical protein A4A49_21492 [Ipomoea trifida]
MGWFARESRGTLGVGGSISPPPLGLMVFLGSVVFWMYIGSQSDKKQQVESSKNNFILRLLVPLFAILLVHVLMVSNRWFSPAPTGHYSRPFYQSMTTSADDSSSPLRLALLLLLLLVLINYQGSVQSGWF